MNFTEIDREDFRNLLHEISEAYMPYGKYGPEKYPPCGVPLRICHQSIIHGLRKGDGPREGWAS